MNVREAGETQLDYPLLAWQGMYALLGLDEEGGKRRRPGSLVALLAHHATRELPTQVGAREKTKPRLKLKISWWQLLSS